MSPRARLAVAVASTGLVAFIALGSLLGRVLGDSTYSQLALFNEVLRIVIDSYVEPINLDRAMAGARMGLTEALDGDTAYLEADEFRAWQAGADESQADVGLLLSRRFSMLMVVAPRPGSPAERGGVRTGDLVKTIDGRHTRPISAAVAQALLRGAPGSVVKLTLLRAGSEPIDVELVRERLQPQGPTSRLLAGGVGYLKVREATARTADEVKGELESLRRSGARSLVLDLRGLAHGAAPEGVRLAELFVSDGVLARLAGANATEQVFSAGAGRAAWTLPMVALVDSGTAGPGEVVAAALLDSERARLVGERTFGRAPFQKAVPLAEGGLVVTVARYVSPKGNAIHGKGVEPNVEVEAEETEPGEPHPSTDPVLERALEVLQTPQKKAA